MNIIEILKKMDSKYSIKNREAFNSSVEKQTEFLNSLSKATTDVERSFNQYLCQMYSKKTIVVKTTNFLAGLLSAVFCECYKYKKVTDTIPADAVYLPDGKPLNIIPHSLKKEFRNMVTEKNISYALNKTDIAYFRDIKKKYAKYSLFLFKSIVKMARYRYLIEKHQPKALIVCNEYSFTSSLMREFCANNGVELINIMHGEKFFDIKDAYFHFDRCYVWDKYYVNLFRNLYAEEQQFIIELPDSMKVDHAIPIKKTVDYTYYLQDEDGKKLDLIFNSLFILIDDSKIVAIRPHPRYSNLDHINRKAKGLIEIEDAQNMSIQMSLARTRNAISLCSTVLNQAYYNEISVVIDDITRPDEFEFLKEAKYIMFNKKHKLLSDEIGK